MTGSREDKERSKKGRYISYVLVLGFMIGFHYLSERNMTEKKYPEKFTVSQGKDIYLTPQMTEILNNIYDMSICVKYYRADASCIAIISSAGNYDKERI